MKKIYIKPSIEVCNLKPELMQMGMSGEYTNDVGQTHSLRDTDWFDDESYDEEDI